MSRARRALAVGLAWLVRETAWNPQLPLKVYFLGWVVFAGARLGVGAIERGDRAAWGRASPAPSSG